MAYRRKQPAARVSTFEEPRSASDGAPSALAAPASLAARAMRASAAHRDSSSLSSAYGESAVSSPRSDPASLRSSSPPPERILGGGSSSEPPWMRLLSPPQRASPLVGLGFFYCCFVLELLRFRFTLSPLPCTYLGSLISETASYEYISMKNLNESKYGFWGTLTRKAKSFIDNEEASSQFQDLGRKPHQADVRTTSDQFYQVDKSPRIHQKNETTHKRSDAIGSSLNHIGGTIRNALEEGLTIVENKTADIIHETRKLNIRRKGNAVNAQGQATEKLGQQYIPQIQTDYETQLKASRDVANAMAAKAKLLLRELKTVKADLAFAKQRCGQLEEENKLLRESHEKGDNPEDDDLIRVQLETLLAEKARLAHENSVYARENRFLREIVEYHQLTMQDVVYVDEGIEEVSEVYMPPSTPVAPSPAASSQANTASFAAPHPPPARINSSPATLQPFLLRSPSIIMPDDCPIVPTPPVPDPPRSVPPSPSAAGFRAGSFQDPSLS